MMKVYKRSSNKMPYGVIAGLCELSGIPVTLGRLVFGIGTIATGFVPGLIVYAALCVISE